MEKHQQDEFYKMFTSVKNIFYNGIKINNDLENVLQFYIMNTRNLCENINVSYNIENKIEYITQKWLANEDLMKFQTPIERMKYGLIIEPKIIMNKGIISIEQFNILIDLIESLINKIKISKKQIILDGTLIGLKLNRNDTKFEVETNYINEFDEVIKIRDIILKLNLN